MHELLGKRGTELLRGRDGGGGRGLDDLLGALYIENDRLKDNL